MTPPYQESFNEPLATLYYWHPAYDNYPVVGVTYEQVIKFCNWRSEINKWNLKFRLPTKNEWIEISKIDFKEKDKKRIKKKARNYFELGAE